MPIITNQRSRIFGGALAVPVPTLGAEILTNGNFETWTSATNAGTWAETVAGTSTINQESSVIHGGSYAARLDIDASGNNARLDQAGVLITNQWVSVVAWGATSAPSKALRIGQLGGGVFDFTVASSSYAQLRCVLRPINTNAFIIGRVSGTNYSLYVDDVSVKPLTLSSLFSARPYTTHAVTKAACTIVAGTRAGVVANLDSATSPANFVIASHDGTTARLTKCVAGTYTELVSTAVTYVAGAFVEIRRSAGTDSYALYYNGSAVGAPQTISDAGITGNTLHGYFNTYSGNTLTGFSCVPSVDARTTAWALAGGVSAANLVAAYQPAGADSLAQSYINLANPGTYNAAAGTAPTFAAATGWTFAAASSQYLTTGITPTGAYTLIVRFSGATEGNPIGITGVPRLYIKPVSTTNHLWGYGDTARTVAGAITSGVMTLAGNTGYINGVADGSGGTFTGTAAGPLQVGGTAASYFSGSVQALAIYNTTLSAAQVLAVSQAMQNL